MPGGNIGRGVIVDLSQGSTRSHRTGTGTVRWGPGHLRPGQRSGAPVRSPAAARSVVRQLRDPEAWRRRMPPDHARSGGAVRSWMAETWRHAQCAAWTAVRSAALATGHAARDAGATVSARARARAATPSTATPKLGMSSICSRLEGTLALVTTVGGAGPTPRCRRRRPGIRGLWRGESVAYLVALNPSAVELLTPHSSNSPARQGTARGTSRRAAGGVRARDRRGGRGVVGDAVRGLKSLTSTWRPRSIGPVSNGWAVRRLAGPHSPGGATRSVPFR
jgi:hypothetical protein